LNTKKKKHFQMYCNLLGQPCYIHYRYIHLNVLKNNNSLMCVCKLLFRRFPAARMTRNVE